VLQSAQLVAGKHYYLMNVKIAFIDGLAQKVSLLAQIGTKKVDERNSEETIG